MKHFMRDRAIESFVVLFFAAIGIAATAGCSKPKSSGSSGEESSGSYLYISSGACHSGGSLASFTATTASNQIFRVNASTGIKDFTLADYTTAPSQTGDSPVAIVNADSSNIYVLVDNATAGLRRVEKVAKTFNGSRSVIFYGNGTMTANSGKDLSLTPQNDFLLARQNAIEKINTNGTRITNGTLAFVVPPTSGACGMVATGTLSQALSLPNGMIAMANVTMGTASKVGIVSATGYSSGANCLASVTSPEVASSLPTSLAFDSTNNYLLVAYAGYASSATVKVNTIYAYSVDMSTGALGATPTKIFDQSEAAYPTFMYGISAMTFDPANTTLYVSSSRDSSATSTGHFIEKFSYAPANISGTMATNVLTRVGTTPFYNYTLDTKCVSSMFVGN